MKQFYRVVENDRYTDFDEYDRAFTYSLMHPMAKIWLMEHAPHGWIA